MKRFSIGVASAILVAAIPPLFGIAFSTSFYAALALLILACPCALVISTPLAIVSALGVYLSLQLDLPTGATIVCTFGLVLILMAIVRPLVQRSGTTEMA